MEKANNHMSMADKTLDVMKIVGSLTGLLLLLFGGIQLAVVLPERVSNHASTIKAMQTQQASDHDLIVRQIGQLDGVNAQLKSILSKLEHLEQIHTKP